MLALYKAYVTKSGRIKVEKLHCIAEQDYYIVSGEKLKKEIINKLIKQEPYYIVYSFSPTEGIRLIIEAAKEERKELKKNLNFLNHILKLRLIEEYIAP